MLRSRAQAAVAHPSLPNEQATSNCCVLPGSSKNPVFADLEEFDLRGHPVHVLICVGFVFPLTLFRKGDRSVAHVTRAINSSGKPSTPPCKPREWTLRALTYIRTSAPTPPALESSAWAVILANAQRITFNSANAFLQSCLRLLGAKRVGSRLPLITTELRVPTLN